MTSIHVEIRAEELAEAGDRAGEAGTDFSSSQTSSKRQPLKTLLTIILRPLTLRCQQVANRR